MREHTPTAETRSVPSAIDLPRVLSVAFAMTMAAACWTPASAARDGTLVFDAEYVIETYDGGIVEDTLASGVFALGPGDRAVRNVSSEKPGWKPGRAFSPDGRWIAYEGGGIFVAPASGGARARRVPGTRKLRPICWALSRGGRQLAFTGRNGWTYVVRRDGRGLSRLAQGCVRDWSPRGWIALTSAPGLQSAEPLQQVSIVRPSGQGLRALGTGLQLIGGVDWSPDGERLAITGRQMSTARTGGLWVIDATTGSQRQLVQRQVWSARWSPDGRSIAFGAARFDDEDVYEVDAAGGRPRKIVETSKLFRRHPDADDPEVNDHVHVINLEWPPIG